MTKSMHRRILSLFAVAVLTTVAANSPQTVLAQQVKDDPQSGVTVWRGAQQRSNQTRSRIGRGVSDQIPQDTSPGIAQHPPSSQAALGVTNRQGAGNQRDQRNVRRTQSNSGTVQNQNNSSEILQNLRQSGQNPTNEASRAGTGQPDPDNDNSAQQQPGEQSGQLPQPPANPGMEQKTGNQPLQDQQQTQTGWQAAQQIRPQQDPLGVPVLSPAANRFFRDLKGPNLSTWNQNRSNYSFTGQTRPSHRIPRTTWQTGSRFGQTTSRRSNYNQTTFNQNRSNYSLRSITTPGFRGYR